MRTTLRKLAYVLLASASIAVLNSSSCYYDDDHHDCHHYDHSHNDHCDDHHHVIPPEVPVATPLGLSVERARNVLIALEDGLRLPNDRGPWEFASVQSFEGGNSFSFLAQTSGADLLATLRFDTAGELTDLDVERL